MSPYRSLLPAPCPLESNSLGTHAGTEETTKTRKPVYIYIHIYIYMGETIYIHTHTHIHIGETAKKTRKPAIERTHSIHTHTHTYRRDGQETRKPASMHPSQKRPIKRPFKEKKRPNDSKRDL